MTYPNKLFARYESLSLSAARSARALARNSVIHVLLPVSNRVVERLFSHGTGSSSTKGTDMTHCDYFVATFAYSERVHARLPVLYFICGIEEDAKPVTLYGARARKGNHGSVGVWDDGRVLVVATGSDADGVARAIRTVDVEGRSIARLDLQATLPYAGADELIQKLEPSGRYQAVRYHAVNRRGHTLYVGAPSSAARLRVYNKTAEAGIVAPDGSELVRYELQCRDKYADAAYRALLAGAEDEYFMHWLRKMLRDTDVLNRVSAMLRTGEYDYSVQTATVDDEWIKRRKLWFETTVAPALRKLLAVEPDYIDVVQSLLKGTLDVDGGF